MSALSLIFISILTGVAGQTVLKLGVSTPQAAERAISGPFDVIVLILHSPLVLLGLLLYGVGALAWIMVLSRLDLSYAYPFLALNFVLVTLSSRLILGEPIPTIRWLGIGFICVGILIVARSAMHN